MKYIYVKSVNGFHFLTVTGINCFSKHLLNILFTFLILLTKNYIYLLRSYHSIKTDLVNAGAIWQNKRVVIDKNIITSREPKDIRAFNKAIISQFGKCCK